MKRDPVVQVFAWLMFSRTLADACGLSPPSIAGKPNQSPGWHKEGRSGARYVDLNLVGDPELAGAAVWLDGERLGTLSRSGTFTWDVPLGVHELRLERAGGGSWSTELRYDESSSGHHRVPVSAADLSQNT